MFEDSRAILIGLALVIVPLVTGGAIGAVLRSRGLRPVAFRASLAAAGLLCWASAALLIHRFPQFGAWDSFSLAFWTSLGLLVSALRSGGSNRALIPRLLITALVTLLAIDTLLRFTIGGRLHYPPPREARLTFQPLDRDLACVSLFPASSSPFHRYPATPRQGPRVLHVGDSMVYGLSVERGKEFPALLEQLQPGSEHINPSQPSAGPDAIWAIADQWQQQTQADRVVFYFFPGNDLYDLGEPRLCCDRKPVLDLSREPVTRQCLTEQWRIPFWVQVSSSPAPYPLRVLARYSPLAALGTHAFERTNEWLQLDGSSLAERADSEQQLARLGRIFRTMQSTLKERQVALTIVVLPYRLTVEMLLGQMPSAFDDEQTRKQLMSEHTSVVTLARDTGIDVIDTLEAFVDHARQRGVPALFLSTQPGDVHFSEEGHRWMAQFLAAELQKRENPLSVETR